MAVVRQSKQIAQKEPAVTPAGAQDATMVFGDFRLAGVALATGNFIEMVELAPGMVPADTLLDTDDLDTGGTPTILLEVVVMTGEVGDTTFANRAAGAQLIASSSVGQTGGIARASATGATRIAPTETRRSIGVRVINGPSAGATQGTMRLSTLVRPAIMGA